MRFHENVTAAISCYIHLDVPEGSCIAMEIDKIGRRLRVVKEADMSHFRAAVYLGSRKIIDASEDKKQNVDLMDDYKVGSSKSDDSL